MFICVLIIPVPEVMSLPREAEVTINRKHELMTDH